MPISAGPLRRLLWVLAATLALVTLAGCTGQDAVDTRTGGSDGSLRFVAGDGSIRVLPATDRPAAPTVRGTLLSGARYDSTAAHDRVLVVNFWGSWCAPCRAEAAHLEQVYQQTKGAGVSFLGVDVRDDRTSGQAYVRTFSITYPSIFDPTSRIAVLFDRLPPNSTPATIVVDKQGRLAALIRRPVSTAELLSVVRKVAAS